MDIFRVIGMICNVLRLAIAIHQYISSKNKKK